MRNSKNSKKGLNQHNIVKTCCCTLDSRRRAYCVRDGVLEEIGAWTEDLDQSRWDTREALGYVNDLMYHIPG